MAMKMLQAGGIEVLTDGVRQADESNPKGYFELEAVKELDKAGDTAWLKGARGGSDRTAGGRPRGHLGTG
jgi:hypothetical protein